jgi:7-carboxy-7-deazaguanine synthase
MEEGMRIHEIFESINGEVNFTHQGSLCTFIRLAGCNLRCSYCDTQRAQSPDSGSEMSIEDIVKKVQELGNTNITITGGEPMVQLPQLKILIDNLREWFSCSVETNGSYKIPSRDIVFPDSWVVDWKGPSSGMRDKMSARNFKNLGDSDFVKFVVQDREDFNDAVSAVRLISDEIRPEITNFAFSPCFGKIDPVEVIKWMGSVCFLKKFGAIFSYQIHKIINVS